MHAHTDHIYLNCYALVCKIIVDYTSTFSNKKSKESENNFAKMKKWKEELGPEMIEKDHSF